VEPDARPIVSGLLSDVDKAFCMKWILVVLTGGVTPVQTDVQFDKLSDCLSAEEQLRKTYADAYDAWDKSAASTLNGGMTIGEPVNFRNEGSLTPAPVFLMLERTSPWSYREAEISLLLLLLHSPRHID
jgi:hypothetical protein